MPETLDDRIVDERLLDDRRDTCRMPQPGGEGFGKLRIGSKLVTVELLDESAGGFMVAAERIPRMSPTQPVELISASGRHRLRVVWQSAVDGKKRLGLQRLPQEIGSRDESSWVIWMLVAIIIGFGAGYLISFRDQDSLAGQLRSLSAHKVIVNETIGGLTSQTAD